MKKTSFKYPILADDHYVLGGLSSLPKIVLREDGNWSDLVPVFEPQRKGNLETFNCTGFATLNCVEAIFKQLGVEVNYSDRFLGIVAGTNPDNGGNDPHTVAEMARKNGFLKEEMLPFSDNLKDVSEFYSFKDSEETTCRNLALGWLELWGFGHEWVLKGGEEDKQSRLMESLKYSPLGVSVDAWNKDPVTGLYVKNKGGQDNHWTQLVWFKKDEYWLVYDSYLEDGVPIKKLAWDYDFTFAKRYAIVKKKIVMRGGNWLTDIIARILDIIRF